MSFAWFGNADKIIGEAAKPSVEQVTAFCLATVKNSHRVGYGWRTGTLARSYTATPVQTPKGPGFEVGSDIYYAPFVEFGTRHMPAQAHLRKAAQTTASQFPGVTFTGGSE